MKGKDLVKQIIFDSEIDRIACKIGKEKLEAILQDLEESYVSNKKPWLMQIITKITKTIITTKETILAACHATTVQDVWHTYIYTIKELPSKENENGTVANSVWRPVHTPHKLLQDF